MSPHTITGNGLRPRRRHGSPNGVARARGYLWMHADARLSPLARTLARAGVEVLNAGVQYANVREAVTASRVELIVATAAAVDRHLHAASRSRAPSLSVPPPLPLLLIGCPTAPGSRRLLVDRLVDFAPEYPTVLEVSVRVERLLDTARRGEWLVGGAGVSKESGAFRLDGEAVALTATEVAIMEALMRSPGAIVPSARLRATLRRHGSRWTPGTNIVPVYVSSLRKKLAALHGRVLIRTHHGRGYSLSLPADAAPRAPG